MATLEATQGQIIALIDQFYLFTLKNLIIYHIYFTSRYN